LSAKERIIGSQPERFGQWTLLHSLQSLSPIDAALRSEGIDADDRHTSSSSILSGLKRERDRSWRCKRGGGFVSSRASLIIFFFADRVFLPG